MTTYYGTTIRNIRNVLCSYCGVKDDGTNQELKKNAIKLFYQYARSVKSLRSQ